MFPFISREKSSLSRFPYREKKTCFLEKNTTFPASTRKIMSWLGPFRKDHLFRTFEENAIFPRIFLRKIIVHFPPRGKIIFSGEINIIFSNNTRKIKFQRIFFGKTIFSGRLEKKKGFPCSERYGWRDDLNKMTNLHRWHCLGGGGQVVLSSWFSVKLCQFNIQCLTKHKLSTWNTLLLLNF